MKAKVVGKSIKYAFWPREITFIKGLRPVYEGQSSFFPSWIFLPILTFLGIDNAAI